MMAMADALLGGVLPVIDADSIKMPLLIASAYDMQASGIGAYISTYIAGERSGHAGFIILLKTDPEKRDLLASIILERVKEVERLKVIEIDQEKKKLKEIKSKNK